MKISGISYDQRDFHPFVVRLAKRKSQVSRVASFPLRVMMGIVSAIGSRVLLLGMTQGLD